MFTDVTESNPQIEPVCSTSSSKRLKFQWSTLHDSLPREAPLYIDRLKQLYPHKKDTDIWLDERAHKYFVRGEEYPCSVSSWWKLAFDDFVPEQVSARVIRRHLTKSGFRSTDHESERIPYTVVQSSVYNLRQHICVFEQRSHKDFLKVLQETLSRAIALYKQQQKNIPFITEDVVNFGIELAHGKQQKPPGPACYYLLTLYNSAKPYQQQVSELVQTWQLHGKIESLKGTFLHKKIQLFINALGMLICVCS